MKTIIHLFQAIGKCFLYHLSLCIPRKKRLVVFGAWEGNGYRDNPKYLLLYLLEHTDMQCVWIGKTFLQTQLPQHPNLSFARHGSLKAFWVGLRAKVWVHCNSLADIATQPIYGGAMLLNLWHGIPIKWMGVKTPAYKLAPKSKKIGIYANFRKTVYRLLTPPFSYAVKEWTTASSPDMVDILAASYPLMFPKARILSCGTPRNDFLIQNASNDSLRQSLKRKYASLCGFSEEKRIILYLPTWRMKSNDIFSFATLADTHRQKLIALLHQENAVLLEKHHYMTFKKGLVSETSLQDPSLLILSPTQQTQIDPQELYLIADVLITDYSSAYLDYALLGKPCLHFIYDYETYRQQDSGLVYDLPTVAAGPCLKTAAEVIDVLSKILSGAPQPSFTGWKRLTQFEKGTCCETLLKLIAPKARSGAMLRGGEWHVASG
jgi:CDP-glycerol glycerophosphotransferase